MNSRFTRTVASLTAVIAAYSVYALVVVPFLEPSARAPSDRQTNLPLEVPSDRYLSLLQTYFPPNHWSLDKSTKVFEFHEQGIVVIQERHIVDKRKLKLVPCAMVFYVDQAAETEAKTRRAIVLEAREGALLEFDQNADLSRLKPGRFLRGRMSGPIHIRSDMDEPGPHDDLELVTHEVEFTERMVHTDSDVQFRLGPNRGQGSGLEIRLLSASTKSRHAEEAIQVEGVQWVELKRNVRMQLVMGGADLFSVQHMPSNNGRLPNHIQGIAPPADPPVPVEVACQGPLHFDMMDRIVTFEDRVDVFRIRSDGESDTLNCHQLSIEFSDQEAPARPTHSADSDTNPARLGSYQPTRLIATGEPVRINSPATSGSARCERLEYSVADQRITLESTHRVVLLQGLSELRAPSVSYVPDPRPGRLPSLWATGPGQLSAVVGDDSSQKFQAHWSDRMELQRREDEPVVSLWGSPQFELTGSGRISADELHVFLTEKSPADNSTPFAGAAPRGVLAKSKASQTRNVHINSLPLNGSVDTLKVWFVPGTPVNDANSNGVAPNSNRTNSPSPPNVRSRNRGSRQAPSESYAISGDTLQVEMAIQDRSAEIMGLTVDGDVHFRETKTREPQDRPLDLQGDWLRVNNADQPEATLVTVTGTPAEVAARGMTMAGGTIRLDRGDNQLWIDTPGHMSLPVSQDLDGKKLANERQIDVHWQQMMSFDGQVLRFERGVNVRDAAHQLFTETLLVTLTNKIRFDGGRAGQAERVDVASLECRNGVRMVSEAYKKLVRASLSQMDCQELFVDQPTGAIRAQGPGRLMSIRRGQAGILAPRARTTSAPPSAAVKPRSELSFFSVDFQREALGNHKQRELTFHGQVRSIRGPVTRWDEVLDIDQREMLRPNEAVLNSDQLTVREKNWIGAERGTIEAEALGNVEVEGTDNRGAVFTGQAPRMKYDQSKELIVLEGNQWMLAELQRQLQPGGPTSGPAARTIYFWANTGQVKIGDGRYLNLSSLGAAPGTPQGTPSTRNRLAAP